MKKYLIVIALLTVEWTMLSSLYAQRNMVEDLRVYFIPLEGDTFCWDVVNYKWEDVYSLIQFDSIQQSFDEYHNKIVLTSFYGGNIFRYNKSNFELLRLTVSKESTIFIGIGGNNYSIKDNIDALLSQFQSSHSSFLKRKSNLKNLTNNQHGWLSIDVKGRDYVLTEVVTIKSYSLVKLEIETLINQTRLHHDYSRQVNQN